MKMFTDMKKNDCVNAFFAVDGLIIPAIVNAVMITEAAK